MVAVAVGLVCETHCNLQAFKDGRSCTIFNSNAVRGKSGIKLFHKFSSGSVVFFLNGLNCNEYLFVLIAESFIITKKKIHSSNTS